MKIGEVRIEIDFLLTKDETVEQAQERAKQFCRSHYISYDFYEGKEITKDSDYEGQRSYTATIIPYEVPQK